MNVEVTEGMIITINYINYLFSPAREVSSTKLDVVCIEDMYFQFSNNGLVCNLDHVCIPGGLQQGLARVCRTIQLTIYFSNSVHSR